MSSCHPMSMADIGLSLTWLLLANGCIPDIFINVVSMYHRFNSKLAHPHCTFTCDACAVSIHPVWAMGVALQSSNRKKFFAKSLPAANLRKFYPAKISRQNIGIIMVIVSTTGQNIVKPIDACKPIYLFPTYYKFVYRHEAYPLGGKHEKHCFLKTSPGYITIIAYAHMQCLYYTLPYV